MNKIIIAALVTVLSGCAASTSSYSMTSFELNSAIEKCGTKPTTVRTHGKKIELGCLDGAGHFVAVQ